jgi:Kef-type K+ transport system membrane component KefB
MRTFAWLVALGLVLAVSHHFTAGAPLAARAALALGAVVVAAELAGRVALRWGLPRVTGFIAAGLLMRPEWLGLVRSDEAQTLGFVGDAAVALFGLRAGLAWRPGAAADGLGRYLSGSVVVPFALTAAAVFALHAWFPLSVHQPDGDALSVALVMGALTIVAAPAVAWATLDDAPRSPLSDTVLRLHTLRDILALIVFAAALALVRPLTSAGSLRADAFWPPLVALAGASLTAGLLVWLVSRGRRLFGGAPGLSALVVALGAALAGASGEVEVTLAAVLAGVGLSYVDRETADVLSRHFDARGDLLAAGAFALVGIRFDVSSVGEFWPWMLLLVAVRALGLYWGGRWAGRRHLLQEDLVRSGWLALVPQAGVGLLLASSGRRAFPEWGVSFEGLAVGLVAIHAVVGPICLRQALARRPAVSEGVSGGP